MSACSSQEVSRRLPCCLPFFLSFFSFFSLPLLKVSRSDRTNQPFFCGGVMKERKIHMHLCQHFTQCLFGEKKRKNRFHGETLQESALNRTTDIPLFQKNKPLAILNILMLARIWHDNNDTLGAFRTKFTGRQTIHRLLSKACVIAKKVLQLKGSATFSYILR